MIMKLTCPHPFFLFCCSLYPLCIATQGQKKESLKHVQCQRPASPIDSHVVWAILPVLAVSVCCQCWLKWVLGGQTTTQGPFSTPCVLGQPLA